MRCQTAAKSKFKTRHAGLALQEKPRDGSRLRKVYDLLQKNKGRSFDVDREDCKAIGESRFQLEDFYGLDIRCTRKGDRRTNRKSSYVLAGEWFGRVYVDYIAEHINSDSQHSSDVEQPHCRRTRADSSPAAGTIQGESA